jgi:hypothetical protein
MTTVESRLATVDRLEQVTGWLLLASRVLLAALAVMVVISKVTAA